MADSQGSAGGLVKGKPAVPVYVQSIPGHCRELTGGSMRSSREINRYIVICWTQCKLLALGSSRL